jgi:hypothetical protein
VSISTRVDSPLWSGGGGAVVIASALEQAYASGLLLSSMQVDTRGSFPARVPGGALLAWSHQQCAN